MLPRFEVEIWTQLPPEAQRAVVRQLSHLACQQWSPGASVEGPAHEPDNASLEQQGPTSPPGAPGGRVCASVDTPANHTPPRVNPTSVRPGRPGIDARLGTLA